MKSSMYYNHLYEFMGDCMLDTFITNIDKNETDQIQKRVSLKNEYMDKINKAFNKARTICTKSNQLVKYNKKIELLIIFYHYKLSGLCSPSIEFYRMFLNHKEKLGIGSKEFHKIIADLTAMTDENLYFLLSKEAAVAMFASEKSTIHGYVPMKQYVDKIALKAKAKGKPIKDRTFFDYNKIYEIYAPLHHPLANVPYFKELYMDDLIDTFVLYRHAKSALLNEHGCLASEYDVTKAYSHYEYQQSLKAKEKKDEKNKFKKQYNNKEKGYKKTQNKEYKKEFRKRGNSSNVFSNSRTQRKTTGYKSFNRSV